MKIPDLNKDQSIKNRDLGIKRAANNAGLNWHEKASEFLDQFPHKTFQAEDVRIWAYDRGLPLPPHCRAWGAVIIRAKKEGSIRHIGYANVDNPLAHGTPASVWEKD